MADMLALKMMIEKIDIIKTKVVVFVVFAIPNRNKELMTYGKATVCIDSALGTFSILEATPIEPNLKAYYSSSYEKQRYACYGDFAWDFITEMMCELEREYESRNKLRQVEEQTQYIWEEANT